MQPAPESSRDGLHSNLESYKSCRERFASSEHNGQNHFDLTKKEEKWIDHPSNFRHYDSESTIKGDLLDQSFERRCATA